jgi:mutator protein MutT
VPADSPVVIVAAAIIERGGRILISRRLEGTHLAGFWEFPGGKCESRETPADCLAREIEEELGVSSLIGSAILVTEHTYPERTVRLHFFEVAIAGNPRPLIGQELRWITRAELDSLPFPPADRELIALLRK